MLYFTHLFPHLYLQSWTKYLAKVEKSNGIEHKGERLISASACFWLLLPGFDFWGEFGVFPIFFNFVGNPSGDSYAKFATRYQVSFYLWPRGPVLKHCKVPKCYDQDCRSVNYMIDFSLSFSFSLQLIT